jgi:hypothetical protein
MLFLDSRSGLIAAKHIVRIGAINTRQLPIQSFHEIDYAHGGEARSTTATADAVEILLGEM